MKVGVIATSSLIEQHVGSTRGTREVATRYGDVPLTTGTFGDNELFILKRAGSRHPLAPGLINYRANLMAMREVGVEALFSTCVVGSLTPDIPPGTLVSIEQFIDFSKHRPPTIFDEDAFHFTDMTDPYCGRLGAIVRDVAESIDARFSPSVCYVGVDGPRYETAAEVRMFAMLGGDVVGHTGATEAVFARELGVCHASIGLVTNLAAGLSRDIISNEHVASERLNYGSALERLLVSVIDRLVDQTDGQSCACAEAPGVPQVAPWAADRFDASRDSRISALAVNLVSD